MKMNIWDNLFKQWS